MEGQTNFTMRIHVDTLKKLRYVAKYDSRSASGQIMYLIHQCIREFEEEQGKIDLSDND